MKTQYKLRTPYKYIDYNGEWAEFTCPGIYTHRYINQLRHPKTYHEIKANDRDREYVRGRRRKLPTSWDDLRPSFHFGSCWKRFTKRKKQWNSK